MIIEGTKHDNAYNLGEYLLREKDGYTPRVVELRDAATDDLTKALTDWEMCARTLTKGQKVMYHTHIRLPEGERMNDAQWLHTIEELEQRLGLTNCPRAIVEHAKGDEKHLHIAWSRLDPVTEKCAPLSMDRKQFHEAARWAEKEFGLSPVDSLPDWAKGKKNRRQTDAELKAFKDRKINKEILQKKLKYAWDNTEDGAEFQAAVRQLDYEIERGERRDFVIDLNGLKVNPVKLLQAAGVDVSAQDFRDRMKTAEMPTGKLSQALSRRQGKDVINTVRGTAANEEPRAAPAEGFTRRRRVKSKGPELKPPGWMRGPF